MSELTPCQKEDPDYWFSTRPTTVAWARRQCWTCPIARACLEGALERGEQYGMFGGFTAAEREVLRRPFKQRPPKLAG